MTSLSLILLIALLQASPLPRAAATGCSFTVAPDATRPEVTGPAAAVRRTRVLPQPESALQVVRVELADVSDKGIPGTVRVEVRNASDRTIEEGAILVGVRTGTMTTGSVGQLRSPIAPGETAPVAARLMIRPDVSGAWAAAGEIIVSIRSVSAEGCTVMPPRMETAAPAACTFTVAADDDPAQVTGSPDVAGRLRVVSQPGSPLQIRHVDLSRLRLTIGETWAQVRGSYTIEVRNVSNRTIERAAVLLLGYAGRPSNGDGPPWRGPLRPGKTVRLQHEVGQSGRRAPSSFIVDFPPGTTAADLQLQALVYRVEFEGCSYQPAQIHPAGRKRLP